MNLLTRYRISTLELGKLSLVLGGKVFQNYWHHGNLLDFFFFRSKTLTLVNWITRINPPKPVRTLLVTELATENMESVLDLVACKKIFRQNEWYETQMSEFFWIFSLTLVTSRVQTQIIHYFSTKPSRSAVLWEDEVFEIWKKWLALWGIELGSPGWHMVALTTTLAHLATQEGKLPEFWNRVQTGSNSEWIPHALWWKLQSKL